MILKCQSQDVNLGRKNGRSQLFIINFGIFNSFPDHIVINSESKSKTLKWKLIKLSGIILLSSQITLDTVHKMKSQIWSALKPVWSLWLPREFVK